MSRTVSSLVAAEDLGWVQGEWWDLIVVVDASGSVAELDLDMEDVEHVEDGDILAQRLASDNTRTWYII